MCIYNLVVITLYANTAKIGSNTAATTKWLATVVRGVAFLTVGDTRARCRLAYKVRRVEGVNRLSKYL